MKKTYQAPHTAVIQLETVNAFLGISWGNIGGTTEHFDARAIYGWDELDDEDEDDMW